MFKKAIIQRFQGIYVVLLLLTLVFLNQSFAAEPSVDHFRIGFSSSMFTDVNENDVRASLKLWGEFIAREQNIPSVPYPIIFKNIDAIFHSLREKEVDALTITIIEYDQLHQEIKFSPIYVIHHGGRITEQYVLLSHKEGRIKSFADLRGASLQLYTNSRACLAPLWLDTVLARQGWPEVVRFAGKISEETKLSKVILPVFFRQADACIVTRSGFAIMAELNPQIAEQLVIIAESPEIVPAMLAFRADYNPTFKDKLISGLNSLKTTPAGRQVLTLFQSEDIVEYPVSCLDTALELIATHKRILSKAKLP